MPRIVDADAHVVEGATFAREALSRWPDKVQYEKGKDGIGSFRLEGRRYPEYEGPGAGCPPQHGLSDAVKSVLKLCTRNGFRRYVVWP